jgi:hypothetical protein
VPSADLTRLTAIVRTCERPQSVERLIRSIGWLHPQLRVLVADDSRKPQPVAGADQLKLPADVGVSACRNALLARVRTPYFLLLEDILELNRRSGIERLLELVAEGRLDIAAGDCVRCQRRLGLFTSRRPEPEHGVLQYGADVVTLQPGGRETTAGYVSCDVTHNFFIGRTDKVRAIGGWDPQLAVDERVEFFARAQRFGLRVGMCPTSTAWRWADRGAVEVRGGRDFKSLAVAKMGVSRMVDGDGRTYEAAAARTRAAA